MYCFYFLSDVKVFRLLNRYAQNLHWVFTYLLEFSPTTFVGTLFESDYPDYPWYFDDVESSPFHYFFMIKRTLERLSHNRSVWCCTKMMQKIRPQRNLSFNIKSIYMLHWNFISLSLYYLNNFLFFAPRQASSNILDLVPILF